MQRAESEFQFLSACMQIPKTKMQFANIDEKEYSCSCFIKSYKVFVKGQNDADSENIVITLWDPETGEIKGTFFSMISIFVLV